MNNTVYQPMECPVCGRFYFSEPEEEDDTGSLQCAKCGWLYDYEQAVDHDLRTGKNTQSVNEYKKWYQKKLAEDPEYDFSDEHCPSIEQHLCPVCGKHQFKDRDSFEICPICGWQDDGLMEDEPDRWAGSSNDLCLNDFRKRYRKTK